MYPVGDGHVSTSISGAGQSVDIADHEIRQSRRIFPIDRGDKHDLRDSGQFCNHGVTVAVPLHGLDENLPEPVSHGCTEDAGDRFESGHLEDQDGISIHAETARRLCNQQRSTRLCTPELPLDRVSEQADGA